MNDTNKDSSPLMRVFAAFVGTVAVVLAIVVTLSLFAPRFLAGVAFSYTNNVSLALTLGRGHSMVYTDIGSEYFGGSLPYNAQLAGKFFDEAIQRDAENYLAHYQAARVAFVLGDISHAQEHIGLSTSLAPEFARNYYMQGLIYGFAKNDEKAEAGFKEFIVRAPEVWAGYVDLSWIYFAQGKFPEGLALLEPVADTFVGIPWFENAYGLFLMHQYRYTEAGEQFARALASLEKMTPADWGVAYPGNDPAFYETGYAQMRSSIENNIISLSRLTPQ